METTKFANMEFIYWNNCLMRLSLDMIFPLYEGLGLILTDKHKFFKLLQSRVKENLLQGDDYPWLNSKIVDEFQVDVLKNLSEIDYNNFRCFATSIYDSRNPDLLVWSEWKDSFVRFLSPDLFQANQVESVRTKQIREKLLKEYREFPSIKEELDSIELNSSKSVTNWDHTIFERAQFDIESDSNNPFVEIRITANMNRFQLFWSQYILTLPQDDLIILYDICNSINLSNNTEDKICDWPDMDGVIRRVEVPGLKFNDLVEPHRMKRCMAE